MLRRAVGVVLLVAVWFQSDVNFAPKTQLEDGWEQVLEGGRELGAATKELVKGPLSPENAAQWAKVAGGQALRGANAVALPARWSLQVATATALAPLSLRLQRLSSKPPGFGRSQMRKACTLLKVDFECPQLFMLDSDEAAIQTLPLKVPKGKVSWAVFVSSHLMKVAQRDQLLALLLREVALLRMRVPPLPQLWVLLAARPRMHGTPRARRVKSSHSKSSHSKHSKSSKSSKKDSHEKGMEIGEHLLHTLEELCRVHLGIHALRARLQQLPGSWRPRVAESTARFQLPGVLGDGADIIGSYADGGLMAGLSQAGNTLEDYMGRYQPIRIGHIALLNQDVLGKPKGQKSIRKKVQETRTALDRVYSIGPERVEGLLEKASNIRHPRRLWRRKKARRKLHLVELWAAASSLSRMATLRADREAVEAMGNINAMAGALVLVHGTATQKRQLHRGELNSLLEDAQAEFPAKHRWPLWFEAFTKGTMEPVLILRLAELRDLQEEMGWKVTPSPTSWWGWLVSFFGR